MHSALQWETASAVDVTQLIAILRDAASIVDGAFASVALDEKALLRNSESKDERTNTRRSKRVGVGALFFDVDEIESEVELGAAGLGRTAEIAVRTSGEWGEISLRCERRLDVTSTTVVTLWVGGIDDDKETAVVDAIRSKLAP